MHIDAVSSHPHLIAHYIKKDRGVCEKRLGYLESDLCRIIF